MSLKKYHMSPDAGFPMVSNNEILKGPILQITLD